MSKAMIQKTPCLTTQRSTKYVSYKKRTKAELEEFGDELYCRMWQEITTSEIKRANRQMTSSISPSGTTIFPFAVGSGYLNEGLALLAQLQDMDVIEMAFSRPRGKPQKTVVK
jgi:hypothetical protein